MSEARPTAERPLSPHLQIYKQQINMVMSIVHRLTGAALYLGTILIAAVLAAAASGPGPYADIMSLLTSWPGKIVLIGYTWALIHHMLGGVRHLIWDTGRGLDLKSVDRLSWMSIIGSVALTVLLWLGPFNLFRGF